MKREVYHCKALKKINLECAFLELLDYTNLNLDIGFLNMKDVHVLTETLIDYLENSSKH